MNLETQVREILRLSFLEDKQDITSRLLFSAKDKLKADIVAKERGIVCGISFAVIAIQKLDPQCKIQVYKKDGASVRPGDTLFSVTGHSRALLAAERKAVNFLQHLSGIATLTSKFVAAAKGTKTVILDTRKTVPGIRYLQKYAVLCGGGHNHRMNLAQMAMIKDNHIAAAGKNTLNLLKIKSKLPKGTLLEIEAKTMKEVSMAIAAHADIIMLDNMKYPALKKAAAFVRSHSKAQIEVSGGVTLKDVRKIARLGVERISVGALTHSAPALDISMEVRGPA